MHTTDRCARILLAAAASIVFGLPGSADAVNLFQIGNSFTRDSKPTGTQAMLAHVLGESGDMGYHIRGNQTLDSLWSDPQAQGTEVTEFGDHTVALPNNHWDYLTLQSFPALSYPTLSEEVARIQDFVAAADLGSGGQTRIIVYTPWAGRSEGNWARWDQAPTPPDDPVTLYSLEYQELLYDTVEELFPGRVQLVNAGRLIREFRDRALEGRGPFETTRDLYRDWIHLSETARFITSTAMLTAITGANPIGVPVPRGDDFWSESQLSDEMALEIQEIVWDVITADRRSGVSPVGDLNVDTVLDDGDRAAWAAAYGLRNDPTTDLDGDRVITEADRQIWADAAPPGTLDANGDDQVDAGDYLAWVDRYGSVGTAGDLNSDGVVNAADYTVWRDAVASRDRLDLDRDGDVDADDSALIDAQLGWAEDLRTDANGDGVVNAADYTVWRDAYEAATAGTGQALPEPSAWLLAATAGLLGGRRRS